jgi:hypothetical protein
LEKIFNIVIKLPQNTKDTIERLNEKCILKKSKKEYYNKAI